MHPSLKFTFALGLTAVATTATATTVPYCSLYARGPQQAWAVGGASIDAACDQAAQQLRPPYTIGRRAQGYFDTEGLNKASVACFGVCYELHYRAEVEGVGEDVFAAAHQRIAADGAKGCIITIIPPAG